MPFSKAIHMYIFDGNPNGRIMCELSNWNGRAYKIARNEINKFSEREDSQNTGVYFLFGRDMDNNDTIYIGEAEKMANRLKQHLKDNLAQEWSECIAVISTDDILNKAHIKYLEHQFYKLAQNSGRVIVLNGTVPTCSSVSEYDEAMLQEFISNTKLLVNTLGYKVFDTIDDTAVRSNNKEMKFYIKTGRGADAVGIMVADGFAVLKGSAIASDVTPSVAPNIVKKRNRLIESGIIDEKYRFTRDYVFGSSSTASAVVKGTSSNGRADWKNADGKSLKTMEEEMQLK